jgi:hypothetical protein
MNVVHVGLARWFFFFAFVDGTLSVRVFALASFLGWVVSLFIGFRVCLISFGLFLQSSADGLDRLG